jgi:multiple sugar transport system permease protein
MPSLAGMAIWHGLGFNVLLYLVRLANIPPELYEAAAVDGAGRWNTFRHITIPLLRPAIFMVLILGLIGSLKVFGPMMIMTDGGPQNSTLSIVLYIYKTAFIFGNMRFGYAAAVAIMMGIFIMTIAICASRLNRSVEG